MKRIFLKGLIGLFLAFSIVSINIHNAMNLSMVCQAAEESKKVGLNYEKLAIDIGQTIKLEVTGISGKTTWKSSNKSIASVNKKGVVTGHSYGSALITALVAKKTFKCKVTITYSITREPYESMEHFKADYFSEFPLILLDMKSAFDDFRSVGYKITGIYGAVHSEKKIYIEGFDSKGKSLGVHENIGLSYLQFDKAVKLRIMNPDKIRYTIDFIPARPTIIDKKGYYKYEDFNWYKLRDGNIQAPFIFAIKNPYLEFVSGDDENIKYNDNAIVRMGCIPHDTGNELDPGYMGAWKNGYFTAIDKKDTQKLEDLWIYVDQYTEYIDEEDFYVYGKTGLDLPDNYKDLVYFYHDAVKDIGCRYYFPYQDIWDKPYRIRFTYEPRSSALENYISMNINDGSDVYYHELAHYYHLEIMDYGCQIFAWTEGIATALAKDAVVLYDEDKNKGYIPSGILNDISDSELKNFENYFLNVNNNDCYVIGYYFIRFIQKEYGESVVLEINNNINNNVPMPKDNYISPSNRNEEADKLFIKAIKDATSDDVFTRFVDEEIKPRLEELEEIRK